MNSKKNIINKRVKPACKVARVYQNVTHGEEGTTVMTRKYRWKNYFCLKNEKEEVIKELSVQINFNQSGIKEFQIIQLLAAIEKHILNMLKEDIPISREIKWVDTQHDMKSPESLFGQS